MPASTPTPEQSQSALQRARAIIEERLPKLSAGALTAGMSMAVAAALMQVLAPKGGLDEAQVLALVSSLGAQWLSELVSTARRRLLEPNADPARIQQTLAQALETQLTDSALRDNLIKPLGIIEATLRRLEAHGAGATALLQETLARGILTKADLDQALRSINAGNTLHAEFGSVNGSVIINATGDVRVDAPITVAETEAGRAAYRFAEDVKRHRERLIKQHALLDLRGFDIARTESERVAGNMRVEDVYTPLLTRRNLLQVRSNERERQPARRVRRVQPGAPARFAALFKKLLGAAETTPSENGEAATAELELVESAQDTPVIEALNDAPRAVILGRGGSGKSTVLKHLALGLCGVAEGFEQEWRHGALLPIWVTLRELVDEVQSNAAPRRGDSAEQERERLAYLAVWDNAPKETLLDFVTSTLVDLADQPLTHLRAGLREHLRTCGAVFLLDGLDEVASLHRDKVLRAVAGLAEEFPRCRFVVACRPYSYRDESDPRRNAMLKIVANGAAFEELDVLPLQAPQIEFFLRKWYDRLQALLPYLSKREADEQVAELIAEIEQSERLRVLAETPLMLTLIGTLRSMDNHPLPRERWVLLERAVELLLVSWQRRKRESSKIAAQFSPSAEARIDHFLNQPDGRERLLQKLCELAYRAHSNTTRPLDSAGASVIEEADLEAAVRSVLPPSLEVSESQLIGYLRDRAGLLLDEGGRGGEGHVYRFPHRMFQEYLTARHKKDDYFEIAPLIDGDPDRWSEVYALISLMNVSATTTIQCVNELVPLPPATQADWERVRLAAEIWRDFPAQELEKSLANPRHPVAQNVVRITDLVQSRMFAAEGVAPAERAAFGRVLVTLPSRNRAVFTCADTRLAACANLNTVEGLGEWLRNGFVLLQPKPFRMQGEYQTQIKAPLLVARTPLTWAQYEAFVHDDGYADDSLWTRAGRAWRRERRRPIAWGDRQQQIANHPANVITWYESMAWCEWMTRKLGATGLFEEARQRLGGVDSVVCRLLTEEEWEFAARGDTLRRYPWKPDGSAQWVDGDELRCNMDATGISRTSPVGLFPDGATPEGILDLSGNVWEWGLTIYDDDPRIELNLADATGYRVLRGGAFYDDQLHVSASLRNRYDPGLISSDIGCRVCLSPLGASQL